MPEEPIFFFDENISAKLATSLSVSGAPGKILHCRTQKMDGMSDSEWIPIVAAKGWIAFSIDRNAKTRKLTSAELASQGATYVMLGQFFDHMGRWEKAKWMFQHWDQLFEAARVWPRGSVWLILKDGKIRREA